MLPELVQSRVRRPPVTQSARQAEGPLRWTSPPDPSTSVDGAASGIYSLFMKWMGRLSVALVVTCSVIGCARPAPAEPGCVEGEAEDRYDTPISSDCSLHLLRRECSGGVLTGDVAYQFTTCTSEATPSFSSGFEAISDFDGHYIVPPDHRGTTSHELSTEQVHSGTYAHRAWMYGVNEVVPGENTNHRGYPTVQLSRNDGVLLGRVLVEFWVWLDVELNSSPNEDWFSFATFTAYDDDHWLRTYLVNLDPEGFVHLMHVPSQSVRVHDIFQTEDVRFPQREWVKLTVYADHTSDNVYESPFIRVWQDDVLVSSARFSPRLSEFERMVGLDRDCVREAEGEGIAGVEASCGLRYAGDGLAQAHFGMYAPPLLTTGTVYNDDLSIYRVPDS